MNNYKFKDIEKILVTGDCHGEFKLFFNNIKNYISIKKEDKDETHPMEVERLARKKAKEQASLSIQMNRPGRNNIRARYEMPQPINISLSERLRSDFETLGKASSFYEFGSSQYSNSIIFVAGDCGFGFNKEKYYTDLLEKYNKILAYNNIYVIFVRGNHDDPSYFDGKRIDFSNIKAVPDYSIVETKDKIVLCVGGAISTDRAWRIEQEKRINRFKPSNHKSLYWPNEAPILDKEKMDEIFGEYDRIDYVVSHTAPSFADPIEHSGLQEWENNDEKLREDVNNERLTMDRIFEYLRDNNRKPTYWAYGHFDISIMVMRSGTWFRALSDGFNPFDVGIDIKLSVQDNGLKNSKKKKAKKKLAFKPLREENEDPWRNDEMYFDEQADGHAEENGPNDLGGEFIVNDEEAHNDGDQIVAIDNVDEIYTINAQPTITHIQQAYANALNDAGNQRTVDELREQIQQTINRLQANNGIFTTATFAQNIGDTTLGEITHGTNNG